MTTMRYEIVGMMRAALTGFDEEAGSPAAINAALLVIGWALVAALPPAKAPDHVFRPWSPTSGSGYPG